MYFFFCGFLNRFYMYIIQNFSKKSIEKESGDGES